MAATNADLKIHMARRHWDIEGLDILNNLPKTYKKEWKCNKCENVFHDYSVTEFLDGNDGSNLLIFVFVSFFSRIFKTIFTVIRVKQTNFNVIFARTTVKAFPSSR